MFDLPLVALFVLVLVEVLDEDAADEVPVVSSVSHSSVRFCKEHHEYGALTSDSDAATEGTGAVSERSSGTTVVETDQAGAT